MSPNSPHHINPLDICRGYGASGERPVAMKSELMMSLCEQQMGAGRITPFHHSIIDRCTGNIYEEFIKSGGKTRQLPSWTGATRSNARMSMSQGTGPGL